MQLRRGLGQLARNTSMRWLDDSRLAVLVRYRSDDGYPRGRHQDLLDSVCQAIGWAGLYPTRAVVHRVVSHWTHGAIAGALTGLGLSQTQNDDVQPVIALAAVFTGAVLGGFLRREVPVYRAAQLPAVGWRLIAVEPEASPIRYRLGRA